MRLARIKRRSTLAGIAALSCLVAIGLGGFAAGPAAGNDPVAGAGQSFGRLAELKKRLPKPKPAEAVRPVEPAPAPPSPPAAIEPAPPARLAPAVEAGPPPPERIEADVSSHTVAVTSVFKGTEIVVFGTVLNSRQTSAEQGYYDIIVSIEGRAAPALVLLKDRVAGVWLNTRSVRFDGLPIYLAIASTRPPLEIAQPLVLAPSGIGFLRARMIPGRGVGGLSSDRIDEFKSAFQRLKEKEGLYVHADYGVGFAGRSLFRASIRLPANIPVGPLTARTFLFHDGQLLATQLSRVTLRRSGIERLIYDFASDYPLIYGVFSVLIACAVSLLAAHLFRRTSA